MCRIQLETITDGSNTKQNYLLARAQGATSSFLAIIEESCSNQGLQHMRGIQFGEGGRELRHLEYGGGAVVEMYGRSSSNVASILHSWEQEGDGAAHHGDGMGQLQRRGGWASWCC